MVNLLTLVHKQVTVVYQIIDQFCANVSFLYPPKKLETSGFLTFSGGIVVEHWPDTHGRVILFVKVAGYSIDVIHIF